MFGQIGMIEHQQYFPFHRRLQGRLETHFYLWPIANEHDEFLSLGTAFQRVAHNLQDKFDFVVLVSVRAKYFGHKLQKLWSSGCVVINNWNLRCAVFVFFEASLARYRRQVPVDRLDKLQFMDCLD